MSVAMRDACLIAYIVLMLFVWGVGYLQGFQEYPQLQRAAEVLTREQFVQLQRGQWAIYALGVVPGVAAIALNAVSLFWPTPGVWRMHIMLTLLLNAGILAATVITIVPLLAVIDAGAYSRQTFQDLIFADFWMRQVPGTFSGLVAVAILWQAVRHRLAS